MFQHGITIHNEDRWKHQYSEAAGAKWSQVDSKNDIRWTEPKQRISTDDLAAWSGNAKGVCQNGVQDLVGRLEAEPSQILWRHAGKN